MNNIDRRIGKTIFTFTLVGTLVGCVLAAPKLQLHKTGGSRTISSGFFNGHYTNEDVKKNRERLMSRVNRDNGEKPKTYEKVRNTQAGKVSRK